ncbi:MAG: hypothetical protein ABFD69_02070 [Candidatus Sumerlaeia bacterium]
MPDIPPIDDLENLSATGAMLEAVLRQSVILFLNRPAKISELGTRN